MGHKGIRDGGPPRRPGFRPEDAVGLPIRRALIELAHQGFDTDVVNPHDHQPRADVCRSDRVRLTVADGFVTSAVVG